jgi:hypothetical protein
MRSLLPALLCACGFGISATSPLLAATLVPVVPVAGATDTLVSSINDKDIITGTYVDSGGAKHGYFGTVAGSYTTFDYKASGNTVPVGIDTAGDITGGYFTSSTDICASVPFERTAKGKISVIKKGTKSLSGLAWGMNTKGEFVGYYCDDTGFVLGYKGKAGKYQSAVTISGTQLATAPSAINAAETIAGWSVDFSGASKGFILKGGVTSFVSYPSATQTQLIGLNDAGLATGVWTDTRNIQHAFMYDTKKSKFTSIEPNGATTSIAGGVNNDGVIALYSDVGTFLYCTNKKKCPKGGADVATGKVTHVPAGAFLRYENDAVQLPAKAPQLGVKPPFFAN